ncbi:tetratricopeptide repeat protein [Algibacillus agarilyticus]|uniref:tetratricopeptide repeat protein n=1 Tax=Algibacillus agarilyticus TaxID=2234133 RepID=UPI000DD09716|nr:tetratricopeptide repeat protein [Algibacillus agarilyticus]
MRKLLINLITISSLSLSMVANVAYAAESQTEEKATKRVPALRAKVYSQLARAQALADEGKATEAIEALDNVQKKKASMNSYEVAMMHNFYAFIHYNQENYAEAISSFKQVVAEEAIPESLRLSTLYSLAQLAMMAEDYDLSINYLEQWMAAAGDKVNARSYVLLAQAHYAKKDYQSALKPLQTAIDLTEADQKIPEENWLVLQRAIYYELKQPAKVAQVLERMVQLFDKPEYWLQLSNMYGELELEVKQMATMETAYQRGFVTKRSDLLTLSQLYVFNRVPYKGAQLLQKAMADGVVEETTQNLKFVAQSLVMAREEKAAIPVLAKAATLAEDGNLDAELAQTLMNIQDFEGAIKAAEKALNKGQLDRPGITHLVLGMSYYNLKKFNEAIVAFESAANFKESQKMANQWTGYVRREADTEMQLAQAGL